LAVATCHGFVNKDRLYLESIRDDLERIADYTAMGEKAFMASPTWACTSSERKEPGHRGIAVRPDPLLMELATHSNGGPQGFVSGVQGAAQGSQEAMGG
jgi:hypothetical protein